MHDVMHLINTVLRRNVYSDKVLARIKMLVSADLDSSPEIACQNAYLKISNRSLDRAGIFGNIRIEIRRDSV